MGLVSSVIPGLFNGVSQQPSTVRLPTQGNAQENCDSNLVTGLTKRPPTEHVAYLGYTGTIQQNAFVHTINRDAAERYIVVIVNGDLKVFDVAGNEKTVTFPSGKAYLSNANPAQGFRMVTIADYSFIVNTSITCVMHTTVSTGVVSGTKQLFSDLSSTAGEGTLWHVQGDPSNKFDDYYVVKSGGVFVETTAPNLTNSFNQNTLPHQLVRQSNGTFTFQPATWSSREVGDTVSSPEPSFIGGVVSDVFFYRNRLGFISGENIICSRSGEYFKFWRETVLDVLDSDPIDTSVSHTKVSKIHSAIPYNKSLMLFSKQSQFIMTADNVLTPSTVKIDQTTEFETSELVRPVASGPNVYFVVDRGNYAGFREYYVDENTATNDASDITKHVPNYVPAGVFKIAASSNEDVFFALTTGERNAIFVYRYYWQGTEKKQSSWSKWTLDAGDVILNLDVINTTLYVLVWRASGAFIEKMDIQSLKADDVGYRVCLDRRCVITGVYNSITNRTTFTFPYNDAGNLQIVLGAAFGTASGSLLSTLRVTDGSLSVIGNYTAGTVYGGRKYTMMYELSEQHLRASGGTSVLTGKLQLRFLTVDYVNTGDFFVRVTPTGRTARDVAYPFRVLGTNSIVLGKPNILSGQTRIPVLSNATSVSIKLMNDSPMPCSFQSLEWTAHFIKHSNTI
jgi:hypothetical protein